MPELNNKTEELNGKTIEEGAGTSDTETADDKQNGGNEDMVSRAEAQKMADAMVAKKLKGMPSKEELAKYKEWQESQKTAEEKQAERDEHYRALEAENASLKQEKLVLSKGVSFSDADYVLFKVSKMEGDFEDNLDKFLSENEKFVNSAESTKTTDGAPVKRNTTATTNSISDRLKARHPNIKLD